MLSFGVPQRRTKRELSGPSCLYFHPLGTVTFIPQRRGSFSEGSHLFEYSLSFILMFFIVYIPLRRKLFLSYCVGGGGGGGGVFTSEIF